jgi:hypothetical protein
MCFRYVGKQVLSLLVLPAVRTLILLRAAVIRWHLLVEGALNAFFVLHEIQDERRCAGEPSRVRRRLDAILSKILHTDDTTLPGTHTSVKLAHHRDGFY